MPFASLLIAIACAVSVFLAPAVHGQPSPGDDPAPKSGVTQQSIYPSLTGQALINKLRQEYSPVQTLGYGPARDELYRYLDDTRGTLVGVYGGYSVDIPQGEDPSSYAYQGGSGISAEHTWPQSKGSGTEPQKSDMHHLFPVKQSINSARSNDPYADIGDPGTDTWYILGQTSSSIPSSNVDAYSESDGTFPGTSYSGRFEPRESHKGNAARAVFYYYVVYNSTISDPNFFDAQKETLIRWHNQDLVDHNEVDRSQWIASRQGTNNPFVLDTTLVRRVFEPSVAPGPNVTLASSSISAAETDGSVTLTVQLNNPTGDAVSVDLALSAAASTADAADFGDYATQTVSFAAGAADGATQSVTVSITDDAEAEGPETGVFQLQNVQAADGTTVGAIGETDVSISDDDGTPATLLVSQYAEDGSVKGIELWNPSGSAIDFSATPLQIERYANGSTSATTDFSKTSGTLAAGEVLVVADGSSNGIWDAQSIAYEQASLRFNGNDAVEVVLGGTTTDVFGTIGDDPGTAWTGSGVSTADQNLALLGSIAQGDADGWTDPSTRFSTVAGAPLDDGSGADLDGFGLPPSEAPCTTPSAQPTNLALSAAESSIDISYTGSGADGYLVVQTTATSLSASPADGTTYVAGDALGGGAVVASTSATSAVASGLTPSTRYTLFVYAYANDGCSGGPAYLASAPLSGTASTTASSGPLFGETFDDDSQYTITQGLDATDEADNYFTRTDGSNIDKVYDGVTGPFFAGQDVDDPQVLGTTPGQLTWTGIDVSGATNLEFSGLFGEVYESPGDIDASDYLLVEARIDGGAWQPVLAFENDGSTYNSDFFEDTDFDGTGDGASITSASGTMESFTKPISGTGSTLDLRFTASVDSGDEDFAIDDFTVTGTEDPLPVELNGLQASTNGSTVTLTWRTLSETNNDGFFVEHRAGEEPSDDGFAEGFETIGFVSGRGTAQEVSRYTFDAGTMEVGRHVFRLRQVDGDGTESLSREVTAQVAPDAPLALTRPAPHPVRTRTKMQVTTQTNRDVRVELYDVLGRRVRVLYDGLVRSGAATDVPVNTSGMSSGVYFVRASGEGHTATQRLVVVR